VSHSGYSPTEYRIFHLYHTFLKEKQWSVKYVGNWQLMVMILNISYIYIYVYM
jgi:hypothetical protein